MLTWAHLISATRWSCGQQLLLSDGVNCMQLHLVAEIKGTHVSITFLDLVIRGLAEGGVTVKCERWLRINISQFVGKLRGVEPTFYHMFLFKYILMFCKLYGVS